MRLAELLAVRLCHDLSGPLGSLMGVIELATEEPDPDGEALRMAGDIANGLARRLRLYRAAWGGATPALSVEEFRALADVQQTRRVDLDTEGLRPSGRFSAQGARLALNVALLAVESLPSGGAITFSGDPRGDVMVRIDGPGAAWPSRLATFLVDETRAWQAMRMVEGLDASRNLQAPLTALIARMSGLRLSFLMAAGTVSAPPLLLGLTPQ